MPVKKGEQLTHVNPDSVSVTELAKMGKCEKLIKVEPMKYGAREHSLFSDDCRRFMGEEAQTWTYEKLARRESPWMRKFLLVKSVVHLIIVFICTVFFGYMLICIFLGK